MKARTGIFLVPVVATALFLTLATGSLAQERSDSGSFSFVTTSSDEMDLGNGQTLMRLVQSGMVFADDPASPLNQSATTCSGSSITKADGSAVVAGHCDAVDADGDVWTLWYSANQDGGTWGYMGGTGKFEGIEGGGTFSTGSAWADGRGINNWEGTYTLR